MTDEMEFHAHGFLHCLGDRSEMDWEATLEANLEVYTVFGPSREYVISRAEAVATALDWSVIWHAESPESQRKEQSLKERVAEVCRPKGV